MNKATAKKIKKLMIDREVSGAQIARLVGCNRQNIYHVIEGRSKPSRIRRAIAEVLGVNVSDLWPDERPDKRAA